MRMAGRSCGRNKRRFSRRCAQSSATRWRRSGRRRSRLIALIARRSVAWSRPICTPCTREPRLSAKRRWWSRRARHWQRHRARSLLRTKLPYPLQLQHPRRQHGHQPRRPQQASHRRAMPIRSRRHAPRHHHPRVLRLNLKWFPQARVPTRRLKTQLKRRRPRRE